MTHDQPQPVKHCLALFVLLLGLQLVSPVVSAAGQVSLSEDKRQIVLSNQLLAVTYDLASGDLRSLRSARNGELLAHGGNGYLMAAIPKSGRNLRGAEFRVVRQQDDLIEISFNRRFPDVMFELHYVLRGGESGLYVFLVQRHSAEMAPRQFEQTDYTLRVDPQRFQYGFTADTKSGPLIAPAALRAGKMIQDATYLLADGTVYTKYDWADFWDHHWGHGLTGTNVGLWMLPGGCDYLVGGPTKQELFVHATDTTPVMMQIFTGGHFLCDEANEPPVTGDWAKISGPTFIYVNSGSSPEAMRDDAKQRAAHLADAWPYRWMENPLYPLERGTVRGRLQLADGSPASNATIVLAAPTPDWQQQQNTYNFWTHADASGAFVLPQVRPGSYTLYGFAPGVLGEFRRDAVVVKEKDTNNLGALVWTPPAHGKLLWQIGVPDRSAAEFRHGDEPRQYGLWKHYFSDFPNDVDFTIGQSHERTDWNYVQPVLQSRDGSYHLPVWNIHFDLPEKPAGRATLSLAIAGVSGNVRIEPFVNDLKVESVPLENDSSVRRSANQAGQYRLRLVNFDAAHLRQGENTVSLKLAVHLPDDKATRDYPIAAVMYDCVRLELNPPATNPY